MYHWRNFPLDVVSRRRACRRVTYGIYWIIYDGRAKGIIGFPCDRVFFYLVVHDYDRSRASANLVQSLDTFLLKYIYLYIHMYVYRWISIKYYVLRTLRSRARKGGRAEARCIVEMWRIENGFRLRWLRKNASVPLSAFPGANHGWIVHDR